MEISNGIGNNCTRLRLNGQIVEVIYFTLGL